MYILREAGAYLSAAIHDQDAVMARKALTAEQARERLLAKHRKYNQSQKGKDRYKKYEDAHPERAGNRWEPARNALMRPSPDTVN
jgi:hypothetical protein